MSGNPPPPPPPPHKDEDNLSPAYTVTGARPNATPSSSAQQREEQRSLIRNMLGHHGRESLEVISRQPDMPQRSDFPSQEEWLRALITSALSQSDRVQLHFGHNEDQGETGAEQDRSSSRDEAQ